MNCLERQLLVDQVNDLHILIRYNLNQIEHVKTSIVDMTNTLVNLDRPSTDYYSKQDYRNDIQLIQHQIDQLDYLNKKLLNESHLVEETILNMRSVLLNKLRRLETQPIELVAPPFAIVARPKRVVRPPNGIKSKTKAIPTTELETILPDNCGICLQQHTKGDTLTCSCTHSFGAVCFNAWMKICKTHNNGVSCPYCRSKVDSIMSYRAKKIRAPVVK